MVFFKLTSNIELHGGPGSFISVFKGPGRVLYRNLIIIATISTMMISTPIIPIATDIQSFQLPIETNRIDCPLPTGGNWLRAVKQVARNTHQ